ncbi:RICIN domain-containing protein [Microbacterium sp. OR21]|uniref:RICIN domain-containing protein n=1 Tax=Microbacterium sp. OR21 TaxID=3095346 RepID=UPI0039B554FE
MTPVFARHRLPVVAGLAAFLVLIGSGSAWSYWTAQTSAAGSVSTDVVAVSHAGFSAPATTKHLPSSAGVSTRSFTVTNGSAISGTATVSITSSEQYAANFAVSVWRPASGGCTDATALPTSGVTTGTWASVKPTLTLNAGATATVCVRTTVPDWKTITDPAGGRTFNPQLNVSLNAQGWVATAPVATHEQHTAGMYPLTGNFFDPALSSWHTIRSRAANGVCLDASGSGGANTNVISWACHAESNQRWQFVPVSSGDQSFVTVRPRHAPSTRLTQTVAGVQQIAASASSDAQRWYVQNAGSFYQLVSAVDGMCLGMNTTSGNTATKVVECDQPAAQLTLQREPLTMSTATSGWWPFTVTTVTLDFNSRITTTGMQLQKKTSTGWKDVVSIEAKASPDSVSFNRDHISNNGTTEFRIVFAGSEDVAYGNILLSRTSGNGVASSGGID